MATLLRNLSTTIFTQFAGLVLGIVSSVVINRALQPEGKGILATYLIGLELVTAFATLGLPKAVIYEIGQARDRRELVASARTTAAVNGLGIGLLVLLLGILPAGGTFRDLPAVAYWLAAATATTSAWMIYLESILRGLNEIWKCNVGSLLRRGVYFLLPLGLAIGNALSLETVLLSYLASVIVTAAYYYRHVPRTENAGPPSADALRSFFRYGLRYQAFAIVSQLHVRLDILIVGYLLTAADVGYYSTAANLAQLLWNLPTAASFVMIPYVANRLSGDDTSFRTAQVARTSTLLLLVLGSILAVGATWAIPILYGSAFAPAVIPLQLLMPGVICFGIVRVLGAHLIGRGRLWELTWASGVILVVNVVLNFALVPRMGIAGAALASTSTYTVNALLVAWLVSREGHVRVRDLLVPRATDIAACLAVLARGRRASRRSPGWSSMSIKPPSTNRG